MLALLCFVLAGLGAPFKSKSRLEAENATLRYQLIVLRRKVCGEARLTNNDRWFFIQLYRWFPSILKVLTIIRPETLVRWHRAAFHRNECNNIFADPAIDQDQCSLWSTVYYFNVPVNEHYGSSAHPFPAGYPCGGEVTWRIGLI